MSSGRTKRRWVAVVLSVAIVCTLAAVLFGAQRARQAVCGAHQVNLATGDGESSPPAVRPVVNHVFVVALENTSSSEVYNNAQVSFLPSLESRASRAANFVDPLEMGAVSEPHYVWMEAGTNVFDDHRFCTNLDPSVSNLTRSADHFVNQLERANPPKSWMTYQEGIKAGTCPIDSVDSTNYAAKHNPFVFFADVVGSPPSAAAARCVEHHRPLGELRTDLALDRVSDYVFITPDLCHDMHNSCEKNRFTTGDAWLATELPPLLEYADEHRGLVFLVWDEGSRNSGPSTNRRLPFYALGTGVRRATVTSTTFTHSSMLATLQDVFGVGPLPSTANANDLRDMFEGGAVPRFEVS